MTQEAGWQVYLFFFPNISLVWPFVPVGNFLLGLLLCGIGWFCGLKFTERFLPKDVSHRYGLDFLTPFLVWTLATSFSARPLMCGILVFLGCLVLAGINAVKMRILREPIVFTDTSLIRLALSHPRLYVAYAGYGKSLLALVLVLTAGFLLWFWEEPAWPFSIRVLSTVFLAGLVIVLIIVPGFRAGVASWCARGGLTGELVNDTAHFGLLGTFIRYFFIAKHERPERQKRHSPVQNRTRLPSTGSTNLPLMIGVQAESFFDPRRLFPSIPDVIPSFRRLSSEGRSAIMDVEGWGGYTMRTEFSFVTGLEREALGLDRYNPYYAFASKPIDSLAWKAKQLGYHTICIHPYYGDFFGRNRAYPQLGFDEFHDLSFFRTADRHGPYVSDTAISNHVSKLVEDATRPLFLFIITMENHGPWTAERLASKVSVTDQTSLSPSDRPAFESYLKHLSSGDQMLGRLAHLLDEDGKGGMLAYFGDHLPSFSWMDERSELAVKGTDVLVWQQGSRPEALPERMTAAFLGRYFRDRFSSLSSSG